jgi:hypothetical protein
MDGSPQNEYLQGNHLADLLELLLGETHLCALHLLPFLCIGHISTAVDRPQPDAVS